MCIFILELDVQWTLERSSKRHPLDASINVHAWTKWIIPKTTSYTTRLGGPSMDFRNLQIMPLKLYPEDVHMLSVIVLWPNRMRNAYAPYPMDILRISNLVLMRSAIFPHTISSVWNLVGASTLEFAQNKLQI